MAETMIKAENITMMTITVRIEDCAADFGAVGLIAPLGISTDHQTFAGFTGPAGWTTEVVAEERTGQLAVFLQGSALARPVLTYRFRDDGETLPERIWAREDSRFTRPSNALRIEVRGLLAGAGGQGEVLRRIVDQAVARFVYGHPERRFNDAETAVPALSCGLTEGSCVDINTYLVASCLAAGIPAAYFAGYFFPEERGGLTNDMHCWVVTRADGILQEWDIAHHMKGGRNRVEPGYNPRPGQRYALSFGRGHRYRVGGNTVELSHFSEPEWVLADGLTRRSHLTARLMAVKVQM